MPRNPKMWQLRSSGTHHTATKSDDNGGVHHNTTTFCMLSYNIGIQNNEAHKIIARDTKYQSLRDDIRVTFNNEHNITIMLISEFGNMWKVIDHELESHGWSTEGVFTTILRELGLEYIKVYANAPYVALIDSRVWFVTATVEMNLCARSELFAQHLIVSHVTTHRSVRVWNSHIPTSVAKSKNPRQAIIKECIQNIFKMCRSTPTAWVIAGDLNIDAGNLMLFCDPWIQPHTDCISKSQWDPHVGRPAQISDCAVSQGIALETVRSFVGWHVGAWCASDVHDSVVVKGELTPDTMLGHESSGIHPADASTSDIEAGDGVHPTVNQTTPLTESSGEGAGHTHDRQPELRRQPEVQNRAALSPTATPDTVLTTVDPDAQSGQETGAHDTSSVHHSSGMCMSGSSQHSSARPVHLAACADAASTQASVGTHHTENPIAPTPANVTTDSYRTKLASSGGSTPALRTALQASASTPSSSIPNSKSSPALGKAWPWHNYSVKIPARNENAATSTTSRNPSNGMPSESSAPQAIGVAPGLPLSQFVLKRISDIAQGIGLRDDDDPSSTYLHDPYLDEMQPIYDPGVGVDDDAPASPYWYTKTWGETTMDARQAAAQNMLTTLYVNGNKSRGTEFIMKNMQRPIQERTKYISAKDTRTSTANGAREYSDAEWNTWLDWYAHNPLPKEDMKELVRQWKDDFHQREIKESTKKQLTDWAKEDTKESRTKARELSRGAFKAMQHQSCNTFRQLAMMFLMWPASQCDQLVLAWAVYMSSSEYKREVNRSKRVDPNNIQEKEAQRRKTHQVRQLRNEYRRMQAVEGRYRASGVMENLKPADQRRWKKYCRGDMMREMNKATVEHGYGTVHRKEPDGKTYQAMIGSNLQIAAASQERLNQWLPTNGCSS